MTPPAARIGRPSSTRPVKFCWYSRLRSTACAGRVRRTRQAARASAIKWALVWSRKHLSLRLSPTP